MAQGVVAASGIAEGHVPEFHLVLSVISLLHGEAALIHGIGDVQIVEDQLQEGGVVAHGACGAEQCADAAGESGYGADVLGHHADAEGSGPCF